MSPHDTPRGGMLCLVDRLASIRRSLALGISGFVRDLIDHDPRSGETCPGCGSTLVRDDLADGGTARFECLNDDCNNPVWFRAPGGGLEDPSTRARSRGSSRDCIACQQPLSGDLTPAWSEGGNGTATVRCERCGARNELHEFGGD